MHTKDTILLNNLAPVSIHVCERERRDSFSPSASPGTTIVFPPDTRTRSLGPYTLPMADRLKLSLRVSFLTGGAAS
jgi:hypothetical protein